ncbi:MAG: uroporphyrinogen-III synthase [Methanosarcinaceae archaeon]|nr:uroporphyrinogen-III synthase [Methanosarcinaceae archaeon]
MLDRNNISKSKSEYKPVLAIMRPESYIKESVELAESLGFETIAVPMIEILDEVDSGFDDFFRRVVDGDSDYVIFTSANGIDLTLRKIPDEERDSFIDSLKRTNTIAIGPNTQKALQKLGIDDSDMPDVYSSDGLVEYLCSDVRGKTIDIARSSYGAPILISGLEKCGASVFETQVYTLGMLDGDEQKGLIELTISGKITVFAFTSSMMVRNFFANADTMGVSEQIVNVLNDSIVAAIGIPTADTLNSYGVEVGVIPDRYIFEALVNKVKEYITN